MAASRLHLPSSSQRGSSWCCWLAAVLAVLLQDPLVVAAANLAPRDHRSKGFRLRVGHAVPDKAQEHRPRYRQFLAQQRSEVASIGRSGATTRADYCHGNKYHWQFEAGGRCREKFGVESKWDYKKDKKCKSAFSRCAPLYKTCCQQKDGAATLKVYCELEGLEHLRKMDQACAAQPKVTDIENKVNQIIVAADTFNRALNGVTTPNNTGRTRRSASEGRVDTVRGNARDDGNASDTGAKNASDGARDDGNASDTGAKNASDGAAPSAAPAPAPMSAGVNDTDPQDARRISSEENADNSTGRDGDAGIDEVAAETDAETPADKQNESDAASPAPAPVAAGVSWTSATTTMTTTTTTTTVRETSTYVADDDDRYSSDTASKPDIEEEVAMTCDELNKLIADTTQDILDFQQWSDATLGSSGGQDRANTEARDPELMDQVKNVLSVGLRGPQGNVCQTKLGDPVIDEEGDDFDGGGRANGEPAGLPVHDRNNAADEGRVGGAGEFENDKEGDSEGGGTGGDDSGPDTSVSINAKEDAGRRDGFRTVMINGTAVLVKGVDLSGLNKWLRSLSSATHDFETKVHPHAYKWWRYRWQYSLVEMMCLCFLWLLIYVLHRVFKDVGLMARARVSRLRNRNDMSSLYQYAYFFVVFHFGIVAVIGFVLWVLHQTTNIFDLYAQLVRWIIIDSTGGESLLLKRKLDLPFRGISYYWQLNDILAHLFFSFALHGLCLLVLVRQWIHLSTVWTGLHHREREGYGLPGHAVAARNHPEFHRYRELYASIEQNFYKTVDMNESYRRVFQEFGIGRGGSVFRFHEYLDEATGRFTGNLVNLELATALVLTVFFAVVGWSAYLFRLGFHELLISWPVLIFWIIIFCLILLVFRYLKNRILSDDPSVEPLAWVNMRTFAKVIQVLLYILFYSMSRIVLSSDFWNNNFWTACGVCVLVVLFFVAVRWLLADMLQFAALALAIPPDVDEDTFRTYVNSLTRGLRSRVVDWQRMAAKLTRS